jgi:hypothetical protein
MRVVRTALEAIEDAAIRAAWFAEVNALSTTNPKCFSKPFARFDKHCKVTIEWQPRNKDEESCYESPVT